MSQSEKNADPVIVLRVPDARVSALGIARWTAREIERGAYRPGMRLKEQDLADLFHCSRAPVREALRILESQGIVVIEPMKGARIASIEDDAFYEVFLIRRALAGLIAQEAAKAPASDLKSRFLEAARDPNRLVESGLDASQFSNLVRKAIRALSELAQKPRTTQLVRSLTFGTQAFQEGIVSTLVMRRKNAKAWAKMAKAIEAGDPDAARAAMEKLFDAARSYVEMVMRPEEQQN